MEEMLSEVRAHLEEADTRTPAPVRLPVGKSSPPSPRRRRWEGSSARYASLGMLDRMFRDRALARLPVASADDLSDPNALSEDCLIALIDGEPEDFVSEFDDFDHEEVEELRTVRLVSKRVYATVRPTQAQVNMEMTYLQREYTYDVQNEVWSPLRRALFCGMSLERIARKRLRRVMKRYVATYIVEHPVPEPIDTDECEERRLLCREHRKRQNELFSAGDGTWASRRIDVEPLPRWDDSRTKGRKPRRSDRKTIRY